MEKKFNTPRELFDAYSNGFPGAKCDPVHLEKFLASLPMPRFATAGLLLKGTGAGKLSLPYKSVFKLSKVKPYTERQTVGDCVSHGTRNAVDVSRAVQIDAKHTLESFITVGATEAIYGSRNHGGDGMSCSTAAEFVHERGGVILRKDYPGVFDLSEYHGDPGWGSRGIPPAILELCKQHPVKTATQVRNISEARDALANGYGIAVCSNQGFSSHRDEKGFASPQGSWSHCYTSETFISGPKSKYIGEVNVGDLVYDHNGDVNEVSHVLTRQYDGNIVKFKVQNLPEFSVTEEHPLLVFRLISDTIIVPAAITAEGSVVVKTTKKRLKNRELLWVKAKDVAVDDMLVCPHISYGDKVIVPEFERPTTKSKNLSLTASDKIAWLFGIYIADGNIVKNHKITITLNKHEMNLAERIKDAIKEFGLETYIYEKKNCLRVTVYSSTLAYNFEKWFGGKANTKRIPEFLLTWNMKEVISGIFCGDGCQHRNAKQISSTSRELINQIWHGLINLGEHPSFYKNGQSKGTFKNAKASWTIRWVENGKGYRGFNEFGYYYLPVKKKTIERYSGLVYNLTVKNSHTYIADNLTTHNCMAWIACDDTGSEPAFLVQNSWGKFNDGGHPSWGPIPDGSFLIHADVADRMLHSDGSFAFSAVKGFPPVKLPDYGSSEYL